MAEQTAGTAERLTALNLREMANLKPPCITARVPFENIDAARIRAKDMLDELTQKLPAIVAEKEGRESLLEPLREFIERMQYERGGRAVVLFRSPDVFTTVWLREPIKERLTIANHFYVRDIMPQLAPDGERKFYILALAQKAVRLLRCTDHSSEEVPLPAGTPHSFDEWFAPAKPDHVLDNKASAGPSEGSMKGVMFTTSTDRESKDEYLRHFYREVEKHIVPLLRADPAPLVLAGVEYELPLYHAIDTYEHTLADGVHGAPDGLKGGEMHARALEVVRPFFEEPLRKALQTFEDTAPARLSTTPDEIVVGAWDGRVTHLFLNETAEYHGWFDEETRQVKPRGDKGGVIEEDLLNAAALRTIAHGGDVFSLPPERMPNHARFAAAVFRW